MLFRLAHQGFWSLTLVAFLFAVMPVSSRAAIIDTATAAQASHRVANLERVNGVLARADVQERLGALGVDATAAAARVAALTDRELAELAERLEQAPAGGDILGVIGVVFVVLIILEIVGVIDIFKKVP